MQRDGLKTPLVTGINRLLDSQLLCKLALGEIDVFTHITQS